MNKTLSLHFEQDFLIAGIEPLMEKFQLIQRRGNSRFPFYFMVDEVNNKIDYSFVYADDFKKGIENIVGDFLNKILDTTCTYRWYNYDVEIINLLLLILDDVKEAYNHIIRSFDSATVGDEKIPVFLTFSDNIQPKSRFAVREFLTKQNFEIKKDDITIPRLFVNHILEKASENGEMKIAVLEALGDNLNMSVVSVYNSYDRERTHFKQFVDFGIDPRIQVISQKIVDDLNRQEGLLPDAEAKKLEYKRQMPKAQELIMQIESGGKPYLQVETTFAIDSSRNLSTNLEVAEIERLTSFHVRQLSRFFADHFLQENAMKVEQISKIILLGNTLCNEYIKKEFSRFGNEKLIYFTTENLSFALRAALNFDKPAITQTSVSESIQNTVFLTNSIPGEYKEVPYISLTNLKTGQKVRLSGFDATQGKGASIKELQYSGDMKFTVISSSRTLMPGDVCKSLVPVWTPGMQIDFQVERSAKSLGLYKTRQIVKIEIG